MPWIETNTIHWQELHVVCMFNTVGPIYKAAYEGEAEDGGRVLKDTTSRGLWTSLTTIGILASLDLPKIFRKCAWPLAHLLCTWGKFGAPGRIPRKHNDDRTASVP